MVKVTPTFFRRPAFDNSVASICTKCFATVAKKMDEQDLDASEQKHRCGVPSLADSGLRDQRP